MDAEIPGCINIRSGVATEVDLCAPFKITNGVELLWEVLYQVVNTIYSGAYWHVNCIDRDHLKLVKCVPPENSRASDINCIKSVGR